MNGISKKVVLREMYLCKYLETLTTYVKPKI